MNLPEYFALVPAVAGLLLTLISWLLNRVRRRRADWAWEQARRRPEKRAEPPREQATAREPDSETELAVDEEPRQMSADEPPSVRGRKPLDVAITVALIAGIVGLATPIVTAVIGLFIPDEPIMCVEQLSAAIDLVDKHPAAWVGLSPDDRVEQLCRINESVQQFLDSTP